MSRATVILNGRADREKVCRHCGRTFSKDPRNTWAYWARAKYCSQDCAGAARAAELKDGRAAMKDDFQRWFDQPEIGCWEWTGARTRDGYGAYSYEGKSYRAHRIALLLDGRAPAPDQYACHHCDNPLCVRPDHLYPGTPRDNMRDAIDRRRVRAGERNHSSKLTEAAVREIRASGASVGSLAKRFGVTHGAVSMARSGKTWRQVQ